LKRLSSKAGCARVGGDGPRRAAAAPRAPHAAAQLLALHQGDEGRARLAQPRLARLRLRGTRAQGVGDRSARDGEQALAVLRSVAPAFSAERERGVAHDAALVAGGVAGVAAIEEARREPLRFAASSSPEMGVAPQACSCEIPGSKSRIARTVVPSISRALS